MIRRWRFEVGSPEEGVDEAAVKAAEDCQR